MSGNASEPAAPAPPPVTTSRVRLLLALLILAYGAIRFLRAGLIPAMHGWTGDFAAMFPSPYFARFRPDFPLGQVWHGGWYAGPMFHFVTLPLLLVPRWWMVPPTWALINVVALAISFACVCRLSAQMPRVPRASLAVLASMWLLFQPLGTCFASGNIEIIEMTMILGAVVALQTSKDRTSGTLIGLATMIKFLPIGFIAWFVLRKRWRAASFAVLAIACVAIVTTVTMGWKDSVMASAMASPDGWINAGFHELSVTSLFLHRAGILDYTGPSIQWLPTALGETAARAGLVASLLLAGGFSLVLIARRRRPISPFEISVLFMTMFLIVPRNHDYYYVFALVPVSVLFLRAVAARNPGLVGLTLVAYFMISLPISFASIDRLGWFPLTFAYIVNYYNVPVLGGLLLWGAATQQLLAEPADVTAASRWLASPRARRTAAALVVVIAVAVVWVRRTESAAPPVTTTVTMQPSIRQIGGPALALSPDGRRIAYVAEGGVLCTRMVDQTASTCWTDTREVASPFFSPDGQSIGFFATSVLQWVPVGGGTPKSISGAPDGQTGVWLADPTGVSPEGVIVYASPYGICRVGFHGAAPEFLVSPAAGEGRYLSPTLLPSGETLLFTAVPPDSSSFGTGDIVAYSLKTGKRTSIVRGSQPQFDAKTRRLIYTIGGRVMAVPFDPETLRVSGVAEPLVGNVRLTADGGADFAMSAGGVVAYVPGSAVPAVRRRLVWVDRQGNVTPMSVTANAFESPRVSPDGRSLTVTIRDVLTDVWTYDIAGRAATRLTTGMPSAATPVWSADGRGVSFTVVQQSSQRLCTACPAVWTSAPEGTASTPTLLWEARYGDSLEPVRLGGWSGDGRVLVGTQHGDLWVLDVAKGEPGVPQSDADPEHHVPWSRALVLQTPFVESEPAISPDGHWIAYASDRSGRSEIYVQSYPNLTEPRQITTDGGASEPVWSRNGRELFYRRGGAMMVMPVAASGTWSAGTPQRLFEAKFAAAGVRGYDVSPDGMHFLMIARDEFDPVSRDIRVLRGWTAALSR